MKFRKFLTPLLFLGLALPAKAQEEYNYVQFSSLREGMASLSLVWNITSESAVDAIALEAALIAKLNDGTPSITPRQSIDLRTILNADYQVASSASHIIATVTAPQDDFTDAVAHFAESLEGKDISEGWLNRIQTNSKPAPSTRRATQENVEAELTRYVLYPETQATRPDPASIILRRPDQVITNGREFDFGLLPDRAIAAFAGEPAAIPTPPSAPRDLPSGVIFLEQDDAKEALIFVADTIAFETHEDQATANTLYRYMGYGPGSEMFTILRQEKRASYDPQSHFTELGQRVAFMGLSANVEAAKWRDAYDVIAQIYAKARAGENAIQGIENSKNQMLNVLIHGLRQEPNFLVQRYLDDFPYETPTGRLNLPLINSSFDLDTGSINQNASRILPPIEDMLTIIIGGHEPPEAALQEAGYCTLSKGEPLRKCLNALSQ